MDQIGNQLLAFWKDERAATAIEYGLLVGILAIGTVGIVSAIGNAMETGFNTVNDNIEEPFGN